MKTITTFLLLLLLAFAVSSCGHGYGMHYSGGHGYTRVATISIEAKGNV